MKKIINSSKVKESRSERGQSLVELAISLTIIMMLLVGAVDFSIAFFTFAALEDAAQEGALYGSINPTDTTGIVTRVRSASTNPVDLSDSAAVDVQVSVTGSACEGNPIQVDVSYDYPISMPFLGTVIGSQSVPLKATVTDTILSPICPSSS
jgi:Flp pilus assembly protein TadG